MRSTIVLVGGFLGAGKTSLMLAAARRVRDSGRKAAVITNDQGDELVDTAMARAAGFGTGEIAGGCFCCRFAEFADLAKRIVTAEAPDVLFAEPVGSCLGLDRLVRRLYGESFRPAPLTILVEPGRAQRLLGPDADRDLAYLFGRQIAEADIVCYSKADVHQTFPELPGGVVARRISAASGEGVGEWLAEVLSEAAVSAREPLPIDMARYAAAEGSLGWLNWRFRFQAGRPLTPAAVAGPLLEDLDARLSSARIAIAHLKVFVESQGGYIKASVCESGQAPGVDGQLEAPPARVHRVTVNLRALGAPEALEAAVMSATGVLAGRVSIEFRQAFRPVVGPEAEGEPS